MFYVVVQGALLVIFFVEMLQIIIMKVKSAYPIYDLMLYFCHFGDMALESCEGGELFDQITRVILTNLYFILCGMCPFCFIYLACAPCFRKSVCLRMRHAFMQQK